MILTVTKASNIIDKEIAKVNLKSNVPALYEPIKYILQIGGKRLRPVLSIYSYSLFSENIDFIIKPAVAVEMFHNFTLMHDDIMDNAPLRRGKETVHVKWDTNTAILSGDAMLIKAYQLFESINNKVILDKVFSRFNTVSLEVCEGQMLDMEFETKSSISISEYIEMIRLKTSVLIGFSLELGALISGANEITSSNLFKAGVNAGIAFQIKDDLLDLYGDANKVGKVKGGDIIANKKTYLLVKFLQIAHENDKNLALEWLSIKDFDVNNKIQFFKSMFDKYQVPTLAEEDMNYYFGQSLQLLDSINSNILSKGRLKKLLKSLIEREK